MGVENPETQLSIYEDILKFGYSVRKVEELVKALSSPADEKPVKEKSKTKKRTPEEYIELQKMLSERLKTNVKFTIGNNGKGSISIPFKSEKQLEQLLENFDKIV